MPSSRDNIVLRLLCHLAWLWKIGEEQQENRTLGWALRIYNSTVHLQFHFVYPHSREERVERHDQQLLAELIERVVLKAAGAVGPLKTADDAAAREKLLDSGTATILQRELGALLRTANSCQWGGSHFPKENTRLDRLLNPVDLLAKWGRHQKKANAGEQAGYPLGPQRSGDSVAKKDLYIGLSTKIVADHSQAMRQMPTAAAQIFREVADAHFSVDVTDFKQSSGNPLTAKIAEQLVRKQVPAELPRDE